MRTCQKATLSQLMEMLAKSRPENWPTLDEWPEVDTSDLEQIFRATVEIEPEY